MAKVWKIAPGKRADNWDIFRRQDLADVVSLIRVKNLDELFQEKLNSSLCGDYLKCLAAKRREDEWEERQNET